MFSFSKIERLSSKKAIEELFLNGKSKTQNPIKLIYKLSEFESPFPARVVFVVPKKKHHRANKRNKLKRRMKEVYRLHKNQFYKSLLGLKYDLMFLYISSDENSYNVIEDKMKQLMKQIELISIHKTV
ncbi:MAG: ribonuclease P protein component [Bacteroidota bacterium]|jgi:ribonuclease P protein component